jgi:hypothetical protein
MSGVTGEAVKELEFVYESDAASSFLVIKCAGGIIKYQAGMLENNDIEYIIPVETVIREGASCFCYNITSQIPLSIYLKRNKLSREAFLRLILNISACIANSAGYLLYSSNFLMKPEFIYIDPGTLDARIVYIPAGFRHEDTGSLQALVSELLMQHINEEGFCTGNLVQRILSEVKSETFSIRGLMALANELLYRPAGNKVPELPPEQEVCTKMLEENREKYKIEEKKEVAEDTKKKKTLYAVAAAVLLQFAMGGVIYMCRGFFDGTGRDAAANYAAAALIVLAIEVLIFRKLHAMKLFSIRDSSGEIPERENIPDKSSDISEQTTGIVSGAGISEKRSKMGSRLVAAVRGEGSRREPIASGVQKAGGSKFQKADGLKVQEAGGSAFEAGSLKVQEAGGSTFVAGSSEFEPRKPSSGEKAAGFSQKTESLEAKNEGEFVLTSRDRHMAEKDVVIDRDEFIIGRLAGHVDHVLCSNAVGKIHAIFIRRNGCCYVRDLNSLNGTFINGRRIESNREILLRNNDNLRLANCEFVFSCSQGHGLCKPDNDKEAGTCLAESLCGMGSQL